MPSDPRKGLRGLPGLNKVSVEERRNFLSANAEKLRKYEEDPEAYEKAAETLYNNQMFNQAFGKGAAKQAKAQGLTSAQRNEMLREKVVNDAIDSAFKPTKTNKGAGQHWNRINELSVDAKENLLNSDWQTPDEIEKSVKDDTKWVNTAKEGFKWLYTPMSALAEKIPGYGNIYKQFDPAEIVGGLVEEGIQQHNRGVNDKILDKIYNDDADTRTKAPKISSAVSQAYLNQDVTGHNEKDTKSKFYEAITPSEYNLGIAEYASHWGKGTDDDITSEMEDFSIDDMRQVLAKKYVYDRTMSPQMAATALNNEAKRYIKEHQSTAKRFGLFAKDVGIASLSYTADKINGIYNTGLIAADQLSDAGLNAPKPTVYVDDQGNVLDPHMKGLSRDNDGIFYIGKDGKRHSVHEEQIGRSTLHNMGKSIGAVRPAGSDDDSVLNPQYWTQAEQFGTLDKDEQEQYAKLGSSPYKVAYDPNEDSDLWYESFKMMSFGLADAASQLIPYGVGMTGRILSSAKGVGKAVNALGKGMDVAGKYLTAQTKAGQVIQGGAGALGIAYAYNRGAFQETLVQNLAKAEELNYNMSKQEIEDSYKNNAAYKAQVDASINDMAASMKADYIAQMYNEGKPIINSPELDATFKAQATEFVLNKLTQEKAKEKKGTKEYAALQQDAINKAGDAAVLTFLPEAVKYGIVNTVGFRKYLYTNPAGLKKSLSPVLKGLKEVTTKDGLKRMTTDATKFGTATAKAKQFGKVLGSQAWGGAWTNGTDDMQVDAAERVAEDWYQRQLDAYAKGEAVADTYGFADGLYSYWRGLGNSLGQETTWQATAVGGLGSIVSFSPNMVNITHLASREGREAFNNRYNKRYVYETGEDGVKRIKKDDKGNPVVEDIRFGDNWRDRFNYFIQNGVLNTYYGNKIAETELQQHADYVNDILDRSEDFRAIKDLVHSDIERENATNIKDKKTDNFIQAIRLMGVLNNLAKDENDPTTMSSVVQNMQDFITKADAYNQGDEEAFSAEEINQLLDEYKSANPQFIRDEVNDATAFNQIMRNAQKLKEARDAYNGAEKQVQIVEQTLGYNIKPIVREDLKLKQALNGHWKERVATMRDEIGDNSSRLSTLEGMDLIATYGSQKQAQKEVKASEDINSELNIRLAAQTTEVQKKLDKYNKAQQTLREATTSDEAYAAQQAVMQARAEYDSAVLNKNTTEEIIANNKEKIDRISKALESWEKGGKVLTADEIFALNPIDRARMMNPENRSKYTERQQREIKKLESRLINEKGADAIQKVLDIASLSRQLAQNEDAYSKIAMNPDAAAVELERQESEAAKQAYDILTNRNAYTLVDAVGQAEEGLKNRKGIKQGDIDEIVYKLIRRYNPSILDVIEKNQLLPNYTKQLADAKEWAGVLSDIDAVIDNAPESQEWKTNMRKEINNVVDSANDKAGIMTNLEKAVDVYPEMEKVLQGMVQLDYHRDATVIESRNERKVREEAQKKAEEERKAKLEAETKAAAEEGKKKVEEKKKELENKGDVETVQSEGNILKALNEGEEVDLGEEGTVENKEDAQQKAENSVTSSVVKVSDGNMQAKSPTVEEQLSEMEDTSNVEVSYDFVDVDNQNQQAEKPIDSSVTTLNGVAEGEWVIDKDAENKRNEKYNNPNRYDKDLAHDHVLVHKEGNNDSMSKYFAWMDNEGIKLQNIIDDEFSQYVAKNPHTKLKFMRVRPDHNATNDYDMISRLMLVIDYDEAINKGITAQHKEENGGIITSDGKKYLVVGTVGYGNEGKNPDKFKAWKVLMDSNGKFRLKETAAHWFEKHPLERFYVHPGLETEVVPGSMIPGYLVKQEGEVRRITDILDKSEMNPHNLKLENLAWGIQQLRDYVTVNSDRAVMVPQNRVENAGRAFVLIPAGNGKLLSAYIEPLQWNDEKFNKDSELALKIDGQFRKLVSPDYKNRLEAVSELGRIFYFSDKENEGDTILIGTDKVPVVTIKKGNQKLDSIDLSKTDGSSAYERLLNAITNQNPRINVTLASLQNADRLLELDEAGALMTDLAKLGTAGVSYSIYSINEAGEMEKPETSVQMITMKETDSSYSDANRLQVPYTKGNFYDYDKNTQKFYLRGKEVTDAATIEELQYAVKTNSLTPNRQKGIWSYYILDADKSEVVRQSSKTKKIERLSEEDAKVFIEQFNQEEETKRREQEMKRLLDEQEGNVAAPVMDEQTGTLNFEETATEEEKKEKEGKEGEEGMTPDNGTVGNPQSYTYQPTSKTQTLKAIIRQGGENKRALDMLLASDDIRAKWPDMPIGILEGRAVYQTSELIRFLEEKGIPITAIGTSAEDFEAWLHLIECA